MMSETQASPVTCAGQIQLNDMAALANRGFSTIICNRPDGEGEDQPSSNSMSTHAKRAGIEFAYLPVKLSAISEDHVARFKAIVLDAKGKLLAYCRTGRRAEELVKRAFPD